MRIIAGKYRGKKLKSPLTDKIRPTAIGAGSRFQYFKCTPEPKLADYALLEIFAGTGAFGLELLIRGVKKICQIEY